MSAQEHVHIRLYVFQLPVQLIGRFKLKEIGKEKLPVNLEPDDTAGFMKITADPLQPPMTKNRFFRGPQRLSSVASFHLFMLLEFPLFASVSTTPLFI